MNSNNIGENIKKFRKQKKLTQKQLGEKCKPPMQDSAIRRYESGKVNPTMPNLKKIADVLGVSPGDLVDSQITLYNVNTSTIPEKETTLLFSYRALNDANKEKVIAYTETLLTAQKMEDEVRTARTQAGANPAPEAPKDTEN